MSNDSNILIYFLISNLDPPQKIFELINSANQEAYIQALEIFQNYVNLKDDEDIRAKRIKIPTEDDHAFHIYITKEGLIFISYSNTIYFPTELNFDLFEEINEYLKTEVNRKINESQSFLIEEEKDEIKDIINYYLEEYSFLDSINTIQTESESEKGKIKTNLNKDKTEQLNLKIETKKENLKESSKGQLLKNTVIISGNKSSMKPKNVSFRQSLKMKHLTNTIKMDKNKEKNKIKFKIDEKNKKDKTNLNFDRNYALMALLNNKSNYGSKILIIVILAFIVAIEVIATILFIYFYDYIK